MSVFWLPESLCHGLHGNKLHRIFSHKLLQSYLYGVIRLRSFLALLPEYTLMAPYYPGLFIHEQSCILSDTTNHPIVVVIRPIMCVLQARIVCKVFTNGVPAASFESQFLLQATCRYFFVTLLLFGPHRR